MKQRHYEQGYNLKMKSMIYVDFYSVLDEIILLNESSGNICSVFLQFLQAFTVIATGV